MKLDDLRDATTDESKVNLNARYLILADLLYQHYRCKQGVHTRLFENIILNKWVLVGESNSRAVSNSDHRHEHVVPLAFLRDQCLLSYQNRSSMKEVAQLIRDNLLVVRIRKREAKLLDSAAGLKTSMPDGWALGDDPFARLTEVGITFEKHSTPELDDPIEAPDWTCANGVAKLL